MGGNSQPLLVLAREDDGTTGRIVLKLRAPASDSGHEGATSLACELICSILARAAGLSVPDYGIALVTQEFAESIPDRRIRELLLRNVGPNFGSIFMPGLALWMPTYHARGELLDRLDGVLTFDATVINGDRTRAKPNLLWSGNDVFLIDHSLALPVHAWSDDEIQESPLFPERNVKKHATYPPLHELGQLFQQVLDAFRSLPWQDVDTLRTWIPPEWERTRGDIDRIFAFLRSRDGRSNAITMDLRRIVK